jgi:hypothetical protein
VCYGERVRRSYARLLSANALRPNLINQYVKEPLKITNDLYEES